MIDRPPPIPPDAFEWLERIDRCLFDHECDDPALGWDEDEEGEDEE